MTQESKNNITQVITAMCRMTSRLDKKYVMVLWDEKGGGGIRLNEKYDIHHRLYEKKKLLKTN